MTALPAVFLPYQQTLMASMATREVTVVEKSRRTGFTWAAAAGAMLAAAASRSAGGRDVLYMSYNQDITREFIEYVADWARQVEPAAVAVREFLWNDPDHPERDIKAFRVDFASGHKVLALPSVPRAFRGHQGDVIVDEASLIEELDVVLTAALALLMWGGRITVIATHLGDTNPFNALVNDIRAGRKPFHLLRCTLDDALADGLYQRMCMVKNQEWSPEKEAGWRAGLIAFYGDGADQELFCIPSPSAGSYLPLQLIEARSRPDVPVLRWTCPAGFAEWAEHLRVTETRDWIAEHLAPVLEALDPKTPHAIGLDFARRGDLTIITLLAICRDQVRRAVMVIELRNAPFKVQEQILFSVADGIEMLRAMALDATGNGMYLAEVAGARYGALVLQIMLTEAWYRENMPPLKAAFEDAMIEVPRDRDLIGDLRALKMVRGVARVPERTRNDEGQQRHGDFAISLVLAHVASRAEPEVYAYDPVASRGALGGQGRSDFMRADTDAEDARRPARDVRGAL